MSETYPSRQSVSADVPDPEEISARFVYNFFVPDEGVNEEGKPALAFGYLSAQTQALIDNRTIERKVPRFVVLDVKRVFKGEYQEFSDQILVHFDHICCWDHQIILRPLGLDLKSCLHLFQEVI